MAVGDPSPGAIKEGVPGLPVPGLPKRGEAKGFGVKEGIPGLPVPRFPKAVWRATLFASSTPGVKRGILGLPVPRSPKLGSTGVIAGRVPDSSRCAKKSFQKAQSPGIRGFGVFGTQVFFRGSEISGAGSMPDAGSWCIEAVHRPSHIGFSVELRFRRRRFHHHPHHQPSSPAP